MRVFGSEVPAPSFAITASLVIVLLAGGPLLTSCHRSDSGSLVHIEHEITPQPPRVGSAIVTLKLSNSSGGPVHGASIRLEGNMTHAGMSPSFGDAEETEPGRYRAPLEFSMSGDWIVLAHITLPGGEKIEKQFDVQGVRSN